MRADTDRLDLTQLHHGQVIILKQTAVSGMRHRSIRSKDPAKVIFMKPMLMYGTNVKKVRTESLLSGSFHL